MEELLFGLTPAEWWVWCYLLLLEQEQENRPGPWVKFPRPGEDPRAEKVFCRKHLKNILKSLKSKRHLTRLIIPYSKRGQIEFLMATSFAELEFPKVKRGKPEFPNNGGRGNPSSSIAPLENCSSPISEAITATLPENNPCQAKLKDSLKALLKQKQQKLLKEDLAGITEGEAYQLRVALTQICHREPQGRYGWKLKLFVIIRYLQEGGAIEKPQRWMNRVASEEHRREPLWSGGSSGHDGRSQYPGRSGEGLTSLSGRR